MGMPPRRGGGQSRSRRQGPRPSGQAPASGGWDLRRTLGFSAILYDMTLMDLQHPAPTGRPRRRPRRAWTRGSAPPRWRARVPLRCVSKLGVGSPAREASVIGSPADLGLLPRPTGSRRGAARRPAAPGRHASSPPPAVPGPHRRAGHPGGGRRAAGPEAGRHRPDPGRRPGLRRRRISWSRSESCRWLRRGPDGSNRHVAGSPGFVRSCFVWRLSSSGQIPGSRYAGMPRGCRCDAFARTGRPSSRAITAGENETSRTSTIGDVRDVPFSYPAFISVPY
jgi:hypothetical protein